MLLKSQEKIAVRATVSDPTILNSVFEEVLDFISKNEYFIISNQQRLGYLNEYITQVNQEVTKLDSLQKREYFIDNKLEIPSEGQLVFATEKETKLYHRELLSLVDRKNIKEQELKIHGGIVTVLEGFAMVAQPANSLTSYFLYLLPWLLIAALVISLLLKFRKQLWALIRS